MRMSGANRITEEVPQQNAVPMHPWPAATLEEQSLLIRPDVAYAQVGLNRVRIDEVLRRLHDTHGFIAEQTHGARQKIWHRHEIGVENRDVIGWVRQLLDMGQCMIHISRPLYAATLLSQRPSTLAQQGKAAGCSSR